MRTALILLFFMSSGVNEILACSCKGPMTINDAFKITETIIHGTVLQKSIVSFSKAMDQDKANSLRHALKEDQQRLELLESDFIVRVELLVAKVYKGNVSNDTINIYTSRTSASCGFTEFEVGKDFLIYASSQSHAFDFFNRGSSNVRLEQENSHWTNHCTRTKGFDVREAAELESLMAK